MSGRFRQSIAERVLAHTATGGQHLMPLPSSESAKSFALGEPGATTMIALHTLGRAALILPGLWIAGKLTNSDDSKEALVVKALGAACALEIFAITWFTAQVQGGVKIPRRSG